MLLPVVIRTSLYKLLLLSDLQLKRAAKSLVGFDKLNTLYIYDMFSRFCTTALPDSDNMFHSGPPSPSMVVHVRVRLLLLVNSLITDIFSTYIPLLKILMASIKIHKDDKLNISHVFSLTKRKYVSSNCTYVASKQNATFYVNSYTFRNKL